MLRSPSTGLSATVEGDGPVVVLVHGVGVGPESFVAVANGLRSSHRVLVVHRPGYGRAEHEAPAPLDAQVRSLAELLDDAEVTPSVVVGVSGGATLALSAMAAGTAPSGAHLLHEPLLGPAAPDLHRTVGEAAAALARDDDPGATARFVATMVGPHSWSRWADDLLEVARRRDAVIRDEVPRFAAVWVDPGAFLGGDADAAEIHTSVGSRSGVARRRAAEVLAVGSGAVVHRLPGCGHLAQLDAPEAVVALAARLAARPTAAELPGVR